MSTNGSAKTSTWRNLPIWDKVFAMAYDLGVRKRYAESEKIASIVVTDYSIRCEMNKGPAK